MVKNQTFGEIAALYDAIYAKKDYEAEVGALRKYIMPGDKVMDIGCGTGRHAQILKREGVKVWGIEPSEEMASVAIMRGIPVFQMKAQEFTKPTDADAVIAMFDVLDYVVDDKEYRTVMRNIATMLKPGGLLYYEGWNKDLMPTHYSRDRRLTFRCKSMVWTRKSHTTYDPENGTYTVDYLFVNHFTSEQFAETHILKPRFGSKDYPDFRKYGFELLEEEHDDFSVRAWLRMVQGR